MVWWYHCYLKIICQYLLIMVLKSGLKDSPIQVLGVKCSSPYVREKMEVLSPSENVFDF